MQRCKKFIGFVSTILTFSAMISQIMKLILLIEKYYGKKIHITIQEIRANDSSNPPFQLPLVFRHPISEYFLVFLKISVTFYILYHISH